MVVELLALLALAAWLYLIVARGGFWLARERDRGGLGTPPAWPSVTAVVPARNEAEGISTTIRALLTQSYPGAFAVVLVDDNSNDGTAAAARNAAAALGAADRLTVMRGRPLPPGWTGKLWAVRQGIETAEQSAPDYLLLIDADIIGAPDMLRRLVARAVRDRLVLTSLMVKLRCESLAERALIPAFVFFFQMLYPFDWVNRPRMATAAAAGGCMLVRSDMLRRAGGIDRIRTALIDDCALARLLKAQGSIWLGLAEHVQSIRAYPKLADIRSMIARSAYTQLRHSPLLLGATLLAMSVIFLLPPLLAVFADAPARWIGLAAWGLMAIAYQPTLRLYRVSPFWGVALPAIALAYMLFTLDSALASARGRGGMWKGRAQATPTGPQ